MKLFLGVLSLACLLILFHEQWLTLVGDFLIVEDPLQPADVIHVIAGDDYRTDYAIDLYQRGYGKTLFFTGGWCKRHQYRHGEHGKEKSVAHGVPAQEIAFDDSTVTSTYMEAERLKEWISHSGTPIHSVIVVSDPYHMRRTRWTYKRVLGPDIKISMAPIPFKLTPYQHTWWRDRQSKNYVEDEYKKYLYYILRYQLSRGSFQKWLVSLDRG